MIKRPAMTEFGVAGFVPLGFGLFLAILMLLPIGTGLAGITTPHLVMISIFYWMTHRPLLVPYGACALLGLFLDLWLDTPLGLNMLMLIMTRMFVLNQFKYFRGRIRFIYLSVFAVMSLGIYFVAWLIISIVHGTVWDVMPILYQWLITVFAYIPLAWILGRLRRMTM